MVDLTIQLPESFFQEEERDGYLVSAKMKELWAVQLDLLSEFNRVCKKYNLKFILDFGTLLGAIRHKGYIPWDDDIDVSMLREDYDKLMVVGPKEFKHPYFLQSQETDKRFDGGVVKLRRSDTTCFMAHNLKNHSSYNQGIFIDIFVYDRLPSDDQNVLEAINLESKTAFNRMVLMSRRIILKDGKIMSYLFAHYYRCKCRLHHGSLKTITKTWEEVARRYKTLDTDWVGSIRFFNLHCRSRKWFEETILVPFENMALPAPKAYDEFLRKCFGDYMTPVREGSAHSLVFFDTNRAYKEILADKEMMKKITHNMIPC